jgi:cleavage and polyadenylation specificity factor subunit 4
VHTKSAADANPLSKEYEDITLSCRDCNAEFAFSAGEQEFYQSKGWENQPTRCTECKNAKKARFGEGPSAGPVCYAFQKGECTRGDQCRFSHSEGGGGGGGGGGFGGGGGGGGAPVCYAFQKGECTRGDACRFSHTEGGGGGGGGGGAKPPCYSFQKGECTRGDDCRFSHDPNAAAPQRSTQPCYSFQKGECTRGDACRFSHD